MELASKAVQKIRSSLVVKVTGLIRSKYAEPDLQDIQMFFEGYLANCSEAGKNDEALPTGSRRFVTFTPALLVPRSLGSVRLSDNSSFSHPLLQLNYLSYQSEVDVLVDGVR
jgi:choline dehydrogenase